MFLALRGETLLDLNFQVLEEELDALGLLAAHLQLKLLVLQSLVVRS